MAISYHKVRDISVAGIVNPIIVCTMVNLSNFLMKSNQADKLGSFSGALYVVVCAKGYKQLYGQNRLIIIYDDKWFEHSYVASRVFCTCVGTMPLYGKMCVCRTLYGEVLAHPHSRCGVILRCRYLGEFGICRYVGCRF